VAALGGNALLQRGEQPAAQVQQGHVVEAVAQLALLAEGNQLVITHGNGPQVGLLALESAGDPLLEQPFGFDALGAETQGLIGYWLLQALENALPGRSVAALVTQTLVDPEDPAFQAPSKFVGPSYHEKEARALAEAEGWILRLDGLRWRRVLASPEPVSIVERSSIELLLASGAVVVCAGGGGIPVCRDAMGRLHGLDAVVDKDLTGSLLAVQLGAEALVLLTDVPGVLTGFNTSEERLVRSATVAEARALKLPAGSMGPKVEAACRFTEATGRRSAIGLLEEAAGLLAGTLGTSVLPEVESRS
jgi:carbamate kinase